MENYTFSGQKYISGDISEELPEELIDYLWELIENLKMKSNTTVDYLQAFDLKPLIRNNKNLLSITHIQEVPPYQKTHIIEKKLPVSGRIFVIDDIDQVTMMWADEY